MDKETKQALKTVLDQAIEAVLITVTRVLGSTPRKPGAKMLVFADGTTVGTIGGGCGEAEARREAFNVLDEHTAKKYCLNMTADIAEEEGMVCGGIMELFIDYIGPQNLPDQISLTQDYLSALQDYANPVLVTVVDAPEKELLGKKLFAKQDGTVLGELGSQELNKIALDHLKAVGRKCQPLLINLNAGFNPCETRVTQAAYQLFIEPPTTVSKLVILGGGHIALPLASMAKMLGYEVTVVDDRPSFANVTRFSTADAVICEDFERALDSIHLNRQTFVVIVTRGHRHDKVCLRKVIHKPAAYIGMIGSRRRVKAMKTELQEEGVSTEALEKLYSPIGLKIGAETPEEIAVSILAELIKVQKGVGSEL